MTLPTATPANRWNLTSQEQLYLQTIVEQGTAKVAAKKLYTIKGKVQSW